MTHYDSYYVAPHVYLLLSITLTYSPKSIYLHHIFVAINNQHDNNDNTNNNKAGHCD